MLIPEGEKRAIGGTVLLLWAGLAAAEPIPTLRIDRRVWALGEDVFFWSGVRSEQDLAPEDVEGCGVAITAPDGSTTQSPFLWPTDGDPRRGWSGGTLVAASETRPSRESTGSGTASRLRYCVAVGGARRRGSKARRRHDRESDLGGRRAARARPSGSRRGPRAELLPVGPRGDSLLDRVAPGPLRRLNDNPAPRRAAWRSVGRSWPLPTLRFGRARPAAADSAAQP